MKNTVGETAFFADGETLTPEQTRKKFLSFSLGERQKKCLDLIEKEHQRILDLGCYTGLFAKALKTRYPNRDIIAGDYDTNNLDIARFIYPEIADSFNKINVYNIDSPDNSFDCIIFQDVIEHLEGAANAIKEINRVLKMDGDLIITTPSPYYYKEMISFVKYEIIRKIKKNLPITPVIFFDNIEWNRHIYCWTPATLFTLLKVNGFDYVSHTYCQDGQSFFDRLLLKIFPFFSPTMILKVKKKSGAPEKII